MITQEAAGKKQDGVLYHQHCLVFEIKTERHGAIIVICSMCANIPWFSSYKTHCQQSSHGQQCTASSSDEAVLLWQLRCEIEYVFTDDPNSQLVRELTVHSFSGPVRQAYLGFTSLKDLV